MSRRLTSVSLANWRRADPRNRRRFVTALGDALREQGGVAVEATEDVPLALREVLEALAVYFGLASDTFARALGPTGSGLEVMRLSRSEAGGQIAIADHLARGEAAVLTAGPALEAWTGGVVRSVAAEIVGTSSTESVWTSSAAEVLPEFRGEIRATS